MDTGKTIFLQEVELSEFCYLQEVLRWVAFQDLPIFMFGEGWYDVRGYGVKSLKTTAPFLHVALINLQWEMSLAPDPRWKFVWSHGVMLDDDFDTILAHAMRAAALEEEATTSEQNNGARQEKDAREEAARLQQELNDWRPKYEKAIELAAAKIYVELREGRLTARGKRLPDLDPATALKILTEQKQPLADLDDLAIPKDFWSLPHIYWEPSAARNDREHYCQIFCNTEQVMSLFPYDKLWTGEPVEGLARYGSFFVLSNATSTLPKQRAQSIRRSRGRPEQHQWGPFHLDMAEVIRNGELPPKREAAIAMVQEMFSRRGMKIPGRTAIREQLLPYYERFGRPDEKKMLVTGP
jgi:hypothetical protein